MNGTVAHRYVPVCDTRCQYVAHSDADGMPYEDEIVSIGRPVEKREFCIHRGKEDRGSGKMSTW